MGHIKFTLCKVCIEPQYVTLFKYPTNSFAGVSSKRTFVGTESVALLYLIQLEPGGGFCKRLK